MKIAIDIREAEGQKTGKGYYSLGLVSNLLKLDKDNTYVLYSDRDKNPFPEQENVVFKKIEAKGILWHWRTLQDLKVEHPDIFFSPVSYIIPAFAPKWLRVIITVHDLVAFLFPKNHNKKAVIIEKITLKRAISNSSKIIVVSENTQTDLIKLFKMPKSLTYEIPCAPNELYKNEPDQKKITEVIKKFNLPKDYLLAVGTLEPRKNFINLVKAFVLVKRKYPEMKLVIVGKKGWQHAAIDKTVKEFSLSDDVIFPGYMKDDELHCAYNLATCFVFPSLYEGFGIPPLEAMSTGCPVVCSNVASLPEVVGDAALMVEPKNSVKIAEAIISVIDNNQLRSMLIERGFKRSQRFSWEHAAYLFMELIQSFEKNPLENDLTKE